ncbi:MAG: hypothetical protein KF901_03990 [Myxococcales bacterium]|nr:hypothetical protein [Myxococcales bacterium]
MTRLAFKLRSHADLTPRGRSSATRWAACVLGMVAALAAGCFRSNEDGRGDAARIDGGALPTDDAARLEAGFDAAGHACGTHAGYLRCGHRCLNPDCPEVDGVQGACIAFDVCLYQPSDPRGARGCEITPAARGGVAVYCWGGDLCVTGPGAPAGSIAGACMDERACRFLRVEGEREGFEHRCQYSDGTYYEAGPPWLERCPASPEPRNPFCGGACGECPYDPGEFSEARWGTSCWGVNEERGFGVCTIQAWDTCRRSQAGTGSAAREAWDEFELRAGYPVACMVAVDDETDDRLADFGVWVSRAACDHYTGTFPGSFSCVGADWRPLE